MITDAFDEVHLELRARLVAVAELPSWKAWENVRNGVQATAPIDANHVDEKFEVVNGGALDAPIAHATIEYTGFYYVGVHGLLNKGDGPIRAICAGILAAFPPGYAWTTASGDRLEIRGTEEIVPLPGPILPVSASKSRSLVAIPWRVWTQNEFPS